MAEILALALAPSCIGTIRLTDPIAAHTPWNANADGVVKTLSGLQYIVLASGSEAGPHPAPRDEVTVHYDGRLAETGAKFDSSYDRGAPAKFPAGRLIPGWVEALQLMRPGDEWLLFIPADLGYGARGTPGGPIPPNADLIFRVALQDVSVTSPAEVSDAAAWAAHMPWSEAGEGVIRTGSGLQYIVLESGDTAGSAPGLRDHVTVYYEGRLAATGTVFDSAYERGEPIEFGVNQVIPGWTEALQLMRPGDRWLVFIPSALGYGPSGTPGGPIPPDADLVFEVQLMAING